MGSGILVCGLNGCGKTTLGKALAEKLDVPFIDAEDLYFPKDDPNYAYAAPRTREQVEELLFQRLHAQEDFVFASVKGDYGRRIAPLFRLAVLMTAPKSLRERRVRERSFRKFGGRMLPGGDLYQAEERFFALVSSRPEGVVEEWAQSLECPVLRVDGTRPIRENVNFIIARLPIIEQ